MSTCESWSGVCVCDHWGGKELWPGGNAEEPQRGEPFERSLNPGGLQVWLAMLLSMLGHNLKGDQRAVPLSSKPLFLPPHLFPSLNIQPARFLPSFINCCSFLCEVWTKIIPFVHKIWNIGDFSWAKRQCHISTKRIKYNAMHHVSEIQHLANNVSDILVSNEFLELQT